MTSAKREAANREIRVGVVGAGWFANHVHYPSLSEMPGVTIVAVSDLVEEKLQATADKYKVDGRYTDYKEMIEKEKPDLVAVCTTATGLPKPGRRAPSRDYFEDAHADISVYAANQGIPLVYSEKAMACSMVKADAVRDACHEHGAVFNTGAHLRFSAQFQVMRGLIKEGAIGEPVTAVHYASSNLLHGHIHSIDTLSYLLGDPGVNVSPLGTQPGVAFTVALRHTAGPEA